MSVSNDALVEVLALLGGPSSKSEGSTDNLLRTRLYTGSQDPLTDSALAMLGFSNSAVQQSLSNISGRTLITILSALISFGHQPHQQPSNSTLSSSCFADNLRPQHEEVLGSEHMCCGGPFSFITTLRIVEESLSFLKGTELDDSLVLELLEMLVKVFCMASTFKSSLAGSCLLYKEEEQQEGTKCVGVATSTFIYPLIQFCLEKREMIYNHFSPMVRLLLWRLQPDLLAGDLSALLEVIAKRPLLSLKNEFRHRQEWRSLVIAMASGPDMFMEGRQILNTWLLASGAPCIWELKGELGAVIRDVLEHPLAWDLSEEVGISLPPLSAFYPNRLHLPCIILNQPPSWAGLLELLGLFENNFSQDTSCPKKVDLFDKDCAKNSECETATDCRGLASQDSLWMLLMDFPAWLLFASLSLFQGTNGFLEGHDNSGSDGQEHLLCSTHQEKAARYVAWHFSPHDQKLRDLVRRMLTQMVQSWLSIKDDKCPGREDKQEIPALKRRKLMDVREMYRDEPRAVDGKIGEIEGGQRQLDIKDALGQNEVATEAVQMWLMNFQDCCCLLDTYSQGGSRHIAATGSKQQAKRRLVMGTGLDACTLGTEHSSQQQPEATLSQCKSSTFLDAFPLAALVCSPHLHNEGVVHLILHFIMMGCRSSSMKADTSEVSTSGIDSAAYQAAIKGLACREPSHRTEDFRDTCQAPFCLNFSLHTSASAASGAARVFRFLETLDLLEHSFFVNGCNGLGWLGRIKEIIARQLQMCIRRWSQVVDNARLTVLEDLRRRAALWAVRTGLESQTLRAFNQDLQRLDILIASSVVEDTLEDAEVNQQEASNVHCISKRRML